MRIRLRRYRSRAARRIDDALDLGSSRCQQRAHHHDGRSQRARRSHSARSAAASRQRRHGAAPLRRQQSPRDAVSKSAPRRFGSSPSVSRDRSGLHRPGLRVSTVATGDAEPVHLEIEDVGGSNFRRASDCADIDRYGSVDHARARGERVHCDVRSQRGCRRRCGTCAGRG